MKKPRARVIKDEKEAALLRAFRENPRRTFRVLMVIKNMPKGLTPAEQEAYVYRLVGDA